MAELEVAIFDGAAHEETGPSADINIRMRIECAFGSVHFELGLPGAVDHSGTTLGQPERSSAPFQLSMQS